MYKIVDKKDRNSFDFKSDFFDKVNLPKKNKGFYNLQNTFAMNYFFKEFTNDNNLLYNFKNHSNNKNIINEIDQTHSLFKFIGENNISIHKNI